MNFKLGSGATIDNPSPAEMAAALSALGGGPASFAILTRAERQFIQAVGSFTGGFLLEFQDGPEDQHFQSAANHLSIDTTIRAFTSYQTGDDGWRQDIEWRQLDLAKEGTKVKRQPTIEDLN